MMPEKPDKYNNVNRNYGEIVGLILDPVGSMSQGSRKMLIFRFLFFTCDQ